MSLLKWWAVPLFFEGVAYSKQKEYKKNFLPSSCLTPEQVKEVILAGLDASATLKARYDSGTNQQKEEVVRYILYRFDVFHRKEMGLD